MVELNEGEIEWVRKLQTLLYQCPSDRIGAYTTGDHFLYLYDRSKEPEINAILDRYGFNGEFCHAVDEVEAGFQLLRMPFPVHSTCGQSYEK